jgi:hypothetical protein
MRKRDGVNYSRVQFFLDWLSLLFRQEWWGHIQYWVYGSLAVCFWRELDVFRILGHNRRPAVPEVLDPDSSSFEFEWNSFVLVEFKYEK